MTMDLHGSAPRGWDEGVTTPFQRSGFAESMQTMGYRALYARREHDSALVLVRGDAGVIGRLTARASVFAPGGDPDFIVATVNALSARGIPYVKIGDTMSGLAAVPDHTWPRHARVTPTLRHTFVLDLTHSEASLVKGLQAGVRSSIKKAEREGLKVREVVGQADLDAYCALVQTTSARVRAVQAYTDFPARFFTELYARLVPVRAAKFYVAWMNDVPLAGAVFLCSAERMLYFSGASTRDRAWTAIQAPTTVLWHAIRDAQALGMRTFDLGGCTPTEDPADPRHGVYAFKKRWGGALESFHNLEVVLSPLAVRLQNDVLSPLWDRLHPLYFRLLSLRGSRP